jgi:hypothetical protein
MLDKSFDTSHLLDINQTITPNGALFSRKKHGFLPELLYNMYNDRTIFKKKMLDAQQKFEDTKDPKYKNQIASLHNKQMSLKIALNSAYGAVGNQYFRFYDMQKQLPMVDNFQFVGSKRHSINISMKFSKQKMKIMFLHPILIRFILHLKN